MSALRRDLILEAARRVFETEGLDGASLRAIAAEAGYTPAALYFHFESKEAIYAEMLMDSLARLKAEVDRAVAAATTPPERLQAAALAFFDFYARHPRDLDLGFYLFRGGMRPKGLGRDRDRELNAALEASLMPVGEAVAAMGGGVDNARAAMADLFAHATGLLLLMHTRRIRMFDVAPRALMQRQVGRVIAELEGA
ncbi:MULTISPECIES: TetR/AcrR family transcriptional regulator [Rhodomicrobium]|uniref:TetR/AcrR family transcriptional regulator n=1 Tax=Rhodomicrobium TaxID=1068 RepID=UPI001FD94DC2|nr:MULTISPECIES: TetR/AcrR family transcriptional regulator [Rhodomicrobium]